MAARIMIKRLFIAIAAAAATAIGLAAQASIAGAVTDGKRVDAVFAKYTSATPGCAVGVATNGAPALTKGYGMADLEHDVPITPDTIFEAGSVSKQFTAAAILLLAREGKLSVDDPVRKYIPELPDYQETSSLAGGGSEGGPSGSGSASGPLLIRHMLNHTSGLRDWGSVAGIAGWPRTTRVHTHGHVLDIVSRQHALNFPPGTRWSYSNTGFNLAAIIVSRVSGVPFADFTRDRIFRPLGMTHTSWRDDYTRIVKNRAVAYDEDAGHPGTFRTDMPFENVYGNGGLLTTVGDLLKWNENFSKPVVGDAAFVSLQQTPGKFSDGRTLGYAFGLYVGAFQGAREVYHSGSTAGYSAFLTRLPDDHLSVAVLCNVATNATALAHQTVSAYLRRPLPPPPSSPALSSDDIQRIAGMYRNVQTGIATTIAAGGPYGLRIENGADLIPSSRNRLTAAGDRWTFDDGGRADVVDRFGTVDHYERVARATPTAAQLADYSGVYRSDEAEVELRASVEDGALVLKRRPDTTIRLTPLYADAFRAQGLGTVIFRRDAGNRPVALVVSQERVWALTFTKKP
jgi:CubicO group peptidase (beta-lactamase class C family)